MSPARLRVGRHHASGERIPHHQTGNQAGGRRLLLRRLRSFPLLISILLRLEITGLSRRLGCFFLCYLARIIKEGRASPLIGPASRQLTPKFVSQTRLLICNSLLTGDSRISEVTQRHNILLNACNGNAVALARLSPNQIHRNKQSHPCRENFNDPRLVLHSETLI